MNSMKIQEQTLNQPSMLETPATKEIFTLSKGANLTKEKKMANPCQISKF